MVKRRTLRISLILALSASVAITCVGLFVIPRPPFPDYSKATAFCQGCPRPFLDLYFEGLVNTYNELTILPRTLAQVGVGMFIFLALAPLILPTGSVKYNERGIAGSALTSRNKKTIGILLMICGLAVFAVCGISGLYFDHTGDRQGVPFQVIMFADSVFGAHVGFGLLAFLAVAVATIGGAITFSFHGLRRGFQRSISFVTSPAAILFVAGIRLFDDKEMSIHALNLLSSVSLYHTDLVSNWTVVVVFSLFAAAGLVSVAVSSDPSHYRRNALLVGGVLALSAMLLTFSIMTQ